LARALAGLGHDVHLLCQDRDAGRLEWVDSVGDWGGGELRVVAAEGPGSPGVGSITVYRPDIAGLLPVYVEDRYAGFEVKAFPDLTDPELERYIAANVAAVRDVDASIGGAHAALANHLIMGPAILARAGLRFAAKVHGSALSYTVKPNERFLPYAREGMSGAEAVLVGSAHTAASLWDTIAEPSVEAKTRLGPPGVDVEAFAPEQPGEDTLADLARRLASAEPPAASTDSFDRNPAEAASALDAYAGGPGPRVAFVGKLIVSKGCDLLLAAWPLVLAARPDARLLVAGFGAYRDALEDLWAAIVAEDLARAREIAELGWELEGGERRRLPLLAGFLRDPPAGWAQAAAAGASSVSFAGRLEHGEVADVLAGSDAIVVPSTFPEAFGMVAAEAASAGVLPVCAGHSGLAEVAGALDAALPEAARGLTAFPLDPGAVAGIAARLNRWFELEPAVRSESEAALRATVERNWSWQGVARSVLDASAGELERLTAVPSVDPAR